MSRQAWACAGDAVQQRRDVRAAIEIQAARRRKLRLAAFAIDVRVVAVEQQKRGWPFGVSRGWPLAVGAEPIEFGRASPSRRCMRERHERIETDHEYRHAAITGPLVGHGATPPPKCSRRSLVNAGHPRKPDRAHSPDTAIAHGGWHARISQAAARARSRAPRPELHAPPSCNHLATETPRLRRLFCAEREGARAIGVALHARTPHDIRDARPLLSWSGGKDAAWTLHVLRPAATSRSSAWSPRSPRATSASRCRASASTCCTRRHAAAGLPVIEARMPQRADNDELRSRRSPPRWRGRASAGPACADIAFGDLFLADIRA